MVSRNYATSVLIVLCMSIGLVLGFPCNKKCHAENKGLEDAETDLYLRQAELFLRLQQAKLTQAEELNRKVANTISSQDVENLKLNVELGKELLHDTKEGNFSGRKIVYLRLAQNAASSAREDLVRANQVRKKVGSAYKDIDIEVLKLKAELSEVNQKLGELAFSKNSIEEELRWKIDMLYDELLKLRSEVKQLKRRR